MSEIESDYDWDARTVIRPLGWDFELVTAPRYRHHYVEREYEPLTAALIANLATRRALFVDVGAHSGFFSLLAASRHPGMSVVALEPVAETRRLLATGVARAGLAGRVEIRAEAASDRSGASPFWIAGASDNCSFYPHPATPSLRRVEVRTTTLDELLAGRPGRERAVIKIDTDGHELPVLLGLERTLSIPDADVRMIVELNPKMQRLAGAEPAQLVADLHGRGFDTWLIDDQRRRFVRLASPGDWEEVLPAQSYANLYCMRRDLAVALGPRVDHVINA